jgi:5-methylcytosine-specific restriction endonuclease McrA
MNSERLDLEFIERCLAPEFQERVDEWVKFESDKVNKQKKEYFKTSTGKLARIHGDLKRRQRMKEAKKDLSDAEKRLIGKFYRNCPPGLEVDHIIPISRGGIHTLSNLQYLPLSENRKKFNKVDWKNSNKQGIIEQMKAAEIRSAPFLQCKLKIEYSEAKKLCDSIVFDVKPNKYLERMNNYLNNL